MSTTLSWYKVGQKVTMKDGRNWNAIEGRVCGDEPRFGTVCSIDEVCCIRDGIYFRLEEVRVASLFDAGSFVPVYPSAIEQLRDLEARPPQRRQLEDAELEDVD